MIIDEPRYPGMIRDAVRRRGRGQSWVAVGVALGRHWVTVYGSVKKWMPRMGYTDGEIAHVFRDVRIGRRREQR